MQKAVSHFEVYLCISQKFRMKEYNFEFFWLSYVNTTIFFSLIFTSFMRKLCQPHQRYATLMNLLLCKHLHTWNNESLIRTDGMNVSHFYSEFSALLPLWNSNALRNYSFVTTFFAYTKKVAAIFQPLLLRFVEIEFHTEITFLFDWIRFRFDTTETKFTWWVSKI